MGTDLFRWRPLTTALLIGGVLTILVATVVSFILTSFQPRTDLTIGSNTYKVLLAQDHSSRERGLSGVVSLKPNEGLLMVYDQNDYHSIWMEGMNIPLDIIWLDESKKVVHIVQDADPKPVKTTIYTPKKPARYVLELPAGSVRQQAIRLGQEAKFNPEGSFLWW